MSSSEKNCFLISHRFKAVLEYYQWAPVHQLQGVEWFLQMRQKEENVEIVLFFKPENHFNQYDKYCRAVADLRLVIGEVYLPLQKKVIFHANSKKETSFFEKILYKESKNSFLKNAKIIKNGDITVELYVSKIELGKFRVQELFNLSENPTKKDNNLFSINHIYKEVNESFQISPIHMFHDIVWFLSIQSVEDNIVVVLIVRPLKHLVNRETFGCLQADLELEIGGVKLPPLKLLDCSTTDNTSHYFLEKTIFEEPKKTFLKNFAHLKREGIPICVNIQNVQIEVFEANEVEDNVQDLVPLNASSCAFSHFFTDLLAYNQFSVHVIGNTEWLVISRTEGESFEICLQVKLNNIDEEKKSLEIAANVYIVVESLGSASITRSEFSETMRSGKSSKTLITKDRAESLLESFRERQQKLEIAVYISNIRISEAKNLKLASLWSIPRKGSDITLLVEGQELHCHSQILKSNSKGLERLIDEESEKIIEISLGVGIGLEDFLEFLYQIYYMASPITEKNLKILLFFAKKYENDEILLLCQNFLAHCLEKEEDGVGRSELLLLSWVYDLKPLKEVCLDKILYSENPPTLKQLIMSECYRKMEEKNKLEFIEYLYSTPLRKTP